MSLRDVVIREAPPGSRVNILNCAELPGDRAAFRRTGCCMLYHLGPTVGQSVLGFPGYDPLSHVYPNCMEYIDPRNAEEETGKVVIFSL